MPAGPARGAEPDRPANAPAAYLITFACYGVRLHGNAFGSVDRDHNLPGSRYLSADMPRERAEARAMRQPRYELDRARRELVVRSIRELCSHRGWPLHAVHARPTHVHVVVTAPLSPEKVMLHCKAYASRTLNRAGVDHAGQRRWSRHGSTRYLWERDHIQSAAGYVLEGQGVPMATWPPLQPSRAR